MFSHSPFMAVKQLQYHQFFFTYQMLTNLIVGKQIWFELFDLHLIKL